MSFSPPSFMIVYSVFAARLSSSSSFRVVIAGRFSASSSFVTARSPARRVVIVVAVHEVYVVVVRALRGSGMCLGNAARATSAPVLGGVQRVRSQNVNRGAWYTIAVCTPSYRFKDTVIILQNERQLTQKKSGACEYW